MPVIRLYGAREGLTAKSEHYKAAVRKYMESKGYALTTDSYIDSTTDDLVFKASEVYVDHRVVVAEVKATAISFDEADFIRDVMKYFREWNKLAANERFAFWVFAESDSNKATSTKLFDDKDPEEQEKWAKKALKLTDPDLEGKKLEKARKDVVRFLKQILPHFATQQGLLNGAQDFEERATGSLSNYAERKLKEIERRAKPNTQRSVILTNLLPIEHPSKVLLVPVRGSTKKELGTQVTRVNLPPLAFPGKRLAMTWSGINAEHALVAVQDGEPEVLDVATAWKQQPNAVLELLNDSIYQHLRSKGFWRHGDRFYLRLEQGQETRRAKTAESDRQVAKLMRHAEGSEYHEAGEPNFCMHDAFEARAQEVFGKVYCVVRPILYPTKDGWNEISDGAARKRILERWPTYGKDRNDQQQNWVRFWHEYAFHNPNKGTPQFGIRVLAPSTHEVMWTPETGPKDVAKLAEFGATT